jgi:hypothetical protein
MVSVDIPATCLFLNLLLLLRGGDVRIPEAAVWRIFAALLGQVIGGELCLR